MLCQLQIYNKVNLLNIYIYMHIHSFLRSFSHIVHYRVLSRSSLYVFIVCACVCVYLHMFSVTQLPMTLCDLMDYSPPGSYVHGIFQVRILEGLPLLSLGDLPNPGLKTCLLHLLHWQVDSLSLCYVIGYLFYIEQYVLVYVNLSIYPSPINQCVKR